MSEANGPSFCDKPFVLQQLLGGRPVTNVHLHDLQDELFVLPADLPFRNQTEWRHCFWLDDVHNIRYGIASFIADNPPVFRCKTAKIPELGEKSLKVVPFSVTNILGTEDVEIATIYQAYELESRA